MMSWQMLLERRSDSASMLNVMDDKYWGCCSHLQMLLGAGGTLAVRMDSMEPFLSLALLAWKPQKGKQDKPCVECIEKCRSARVSRITCLAIPWAMAPCNVMSGSCVFVGFSFPLCEVASLTRIYSDLFQRRRQRQKPRKVVTLARCTLCLEDLCSLACLLSCARKVHARLL